MNNEQQPPVSSLGVADILALKQIIDLASKRGAFQVEEFTAVGTVYHKLIQFLEFAKNQAEQARGRAEDDQKTVTEQSKEEK